MVQGIPPLHKAIAVLRQSMRGVGSGAARAGRGTGTTARDTQRTSGGSSKVASLAASLATIEPNDPHRQRKALRAFIEATLLDEFGEELILSSDFQGTVDRTLETLMGDPAVAPLLDQATRELGVQPD
jgi:hypothetical protein